ncbi:MAG: leucine-rich repeat protein, partial [Oscillospiraceae bacterium]|nr:leucine-rich repeat protein [Oscillospiraceae bacterium]
SLDNAIVGSPSTGYGAMSVASVQNSAAEANYFLLGDVEEDNKIAFNFMIYAGNSTPVDFFTQLRTWNENTYTNEIVVVPGIGEETDYEGLDVTGKIALIKRGVTNFEDKAKIAQSHGANAVIIYNNEDEAIAPAYNTYSIPMIGITLSDGEKLIAAAEAGNGTVTFGPATASGYYYATPVEERIPWVAVLPASDAGRMSSFSSIGPGTDLTIKPEISAPGGNIISSVIGGGYGSMSGTSMATPHMAGAAAVVRNYVRNELGITDMRQIRDVSDALLMSTATPAINSAGFEYSPRWQGAGIVNVKNAVTANAYLTLDKIDASDPDDVITQTRPKAELGWNDEGVYTFTFKVHNVSDAAINYTLSAVSLTEGIVNQYGVDFSDGVATRLDAEDFTMNFSCGNSLTVAAGETVEVTATLALTESYKTELFQNFENGNYVEGFVYLQPAEGVTLVLPYLGYCGDWLDAGTVFEGAPDSNWQLQPSLFATVSTTGVGYYLAQDAYTGTYNFDRLAFSPKIDGAQQFLGTILTTRRNLTDFKMVITNADGEELWGLTSSYLTKSYYYYGYAAVINTQILTDGWNGRYYNEETGAFDGDYVPSGQYYYTFSGNVGQSEDGYTETSYPLWLDGGAPEISNVQTYKDTDGTFKLAFDVQDDHYVRIINIIDSTNTWLLTYTIEDFAQIEEQGTKSRVIIDLDDLCQFLSDNGLNPGTIKLQASDYALSKGYAYVNLGPEYISVANMTIAKGDSQQASLRILPADKADSFKLTWTSADESIATVDQNGLVTGVEYGTTTIRATADSGLYGEAIVTIGDETLPPEEPEIPDPDAHVDYPSAEVTETVWDTRVAASDTPYLNDRFEVDGLWYKVTGADTVQLIKNPNVANTWSATYPDAPAELVIPETVTYEGQDFTVTTIGESAFYMCGQFTSITLPDTIRVIGDQAFHTTWGSSKVTDFELPEGLEEIGKWGLYGHSNVDFMLPNSLRYIGREAFNNTGITEVDFGENLEYVGYRAFNMCSKLVKAELPIEAQDTNGAFMHCSALTEVTVEEGVERIPEYCFYGCTALKTIKYPASVKELVAGAFYSAGLEDLCLEGSNITTIGDFAFASLTNCYDFVIPDSVTYVGANAFYWARYVRSITFGENVAYVGEGTMDTFFIHNDVTAARIEVKSATAGAAVRRSGYLGLIYKDGVKFDVYTGAPFTIDGLTYTPISADEVMLTDVQDGVTGIITIPAQVTCEGDDITYTVTAVGARVFSQKYYITEIHLPDTITTVAERGFDQVQALEYINIPKSLTTLSGIQAFGYGGWNPSEWSGVWNPDTLTIPGTLKSWHTSAFAGNRYTSIVVEEGVDHIGDYGFYGNLDVENITLPSSLRVIEANSMANMSSLHELSIPEGLEYIGEQAFFGTPLESIDLPDSLQYIGTQAFSCYETDYNTPYPFVTTYTGIEELNLPGGVIGMGWNAVEPMVKVTTVLGSQRNLVVERNNLNEGNLPTVIWDGRTDIPAGDYSVIPEGMTVTMEEGTVIEGTLYVEGTLIHNCITDPGENLVVSGEVIVEHDYTETVVAPACDEDGYTEHLCNLCKHSYRDNYVEAPGHNYEATVVAPTCTEMGFTTYTCATCGYSYVGDIVEAKGHDYTSVVTEATCTEAGYTTHTCATCGHSYVDSVVQPKGHAYTASVTEPTHEKMGYTTYTCAIC